MENGVLVAYASKHGATTEIAERIGEVLQKEGLEVEVLSIERVSDINRYKAVIMGSAAYIGQWRKEAVKFLNNNEKLLAERPVWLFSSGPTGEGDPVELVSGWLYPGKIKTVIDTIQPRDIAVFHGAIDVNKLGFLEKFAIKNVKAPVGDFRDWDSITAWAMKIAGDLKKGD